MHFGATEKLKMSTNSGKRTADVALDEELVSLVVPKVVKRVKIEPGMTIIRVTYGAKFLNSCGRYFASNKHSANLTKVVANAEEGAELPVRYEQAESATRWRCMALFLILLAAMLCLD